MSTLSVLALAVLGCPQLLPDDFSSQLPSDLGTLPDDSLVLDGRSGASQGGSAGTTASSPDAGATHPLLLPDGGTRPPPPPPPPPDSGPLGCVPGVESCDGRDNDCDNVIDEAPACPGDCTGVVVAGRGGMFCGGAGDTFAGAETRCSAQGMHPVVLDSAEKSTTLLQAILPLYTSPLSEAQNSLWLDAQDGETEGTWHWGATGSVFWLGDSTGSAQNDAYVSWASGKPNNSGTGDGEDCLVMHVDGSADPVGTWNDETCDGVHVFFCEAPGP